MCNDVQELPLPQKLSLQLLGAVKCLLSGHGKSATICDIARCAPGTIGGAACHGKAQNHSCFQNQTRPKRKIRLDVFRVFQR
jgi:hypothetical protein